MHMLTGQLRLRGVDAAIPELTIHVYAVGPRQVPQTILDPDTWDALMRADWKGLDAQRLGSVLSNADGAFQASYDPKSLPRGQSPNLWVAVTGPDLSGAQVCERVVHASCDIRGNAGPRESVVLHLEEHRLRALGLLGGTPRTARGVVASDMLTQVERAARQTATPDLDGQRFSTFFNARQTEVATENAAAGIHAPRQAEVGLTISLRPLETANARALTLHKDNATGRLTVSTDGQADAQPLNFAGVKRLGAKDRSPRDAASHVRIDPERGNFELHLASVPDRLTVEEPDTLALWTPQTAKNGGTN